MAADAVASLIRQLREELDAKDAPAPLFTSGCPILIAEVGELTRNVDPAEYDPQHISLGPYNRIKKPHLARDDEKIRCLSAVLSAASGGMMLQDYLAELVGLEGKARSCYAHTFSMESSEFVRMLLLDACYVLVRFCRGNGGGGDVQGRPPYCRSEARSVAGDVMDAVAVVRDVLYLAENQIPFFVIDKVHQLTVSDAGVSAADAIAGYVRELLRGQRQYSVATPALGAPPGPGNLLRLLHMHLTPTVLLSSVTSNKVTCRKRRVGRWRSATDYYCAGMGFRTRLLGGKDVDSILDVKLDGGTLEIPCLNIDAETWRLLRNLMALEQRNPAAGSHVTAYCVFVSQLARTQWDVELLSRCGVISHGLGSHEDEVAACFADLCKGVTFAANDPVGNYLSATWQAAEERFQSRPRRWAAWLILQYFTNPLVTVGLAAATLGMGCTVLQSVYSVLSYKQGAT